MELYNQISPQIKTIEMMINNEDDTKMIKSVAGVFFKDIQSEILRSEMKNCLIHKDCKYNPVVSIGPSNSKIMIIGSAPGEAEAEEDQRRSSPRSSRPLRGCSTKCGGGLRIRRENLQEGTRA